ncbi:MAG: ankyrin repeat domain-containing protein [Bacteroidota bacterium]
MMHLIRNFFLLIATTIGFLTLICLISCADTAMADKQQTEATSQVPNRTIHEAAFLGDLRLLQAHIAAGTDLNQRDDFGATPLIIATTFGKTAIAKQLIEAGVDLNLTGADGGTALHGAAFYCRTEILKVLLSNGADTEIRNQFGATALESVEAPFEVVKPAYDQISKDLGPLGFKLDYDYLKSSRPQVAEMIRQAQ